MCRLAWTSGTSGGPILLTAGKGTLSSDKEDLGGRPRRAGWHGHRSERRELRGGGEEESLGCKAFSLQKFPKWL